MSILEHAQHIIIEPTVENLQEIGIEDTTEYDWILERHEFDKDIRAYEVLQYFNVTPDSDPEKLAMVKDIYSWLLVGNEDTLIPTIQSLEIKMGKPIGMTKIDMLWQYLALEKQEKAIQKQKRQIENE